MAELATAAATFINGTAFGALAFVGAVDAPMLLRLRTTRNGRVTVANLFPIWWPLGRTFMAPLGVSGIVVNGIAYYVSRSPVRVWWLFPAAMHIATIAWTAGIMSAPIKALRFGKENSVEDERHTAANEQNIKKFSYLHYPRIFFGAISFLVSLALQSNLLA
ncbi:hypothetical protein HK100_005601 [Physocladia obscura]|uniref:Uncharacterized protein n=1 Tax=Physocladia obscura TaxID=109957 RepID=A0AAD5STJ6_9FUNG|nr:hypothetical protein HK100_005601 [Physocladia obscura]